VALLERLLRTEYVINFIIIIIIIIIICLSSIPVYYSLVTTVKVQVVAMHVMKSCRKIGV
jgi:hypothetical protein